jgi:linoleoyl-CoA desaturase
MSTHQIKYPNKNKPDFINELRHQVKEYFETNNISKYGNSTLVMKSIFMILLYFIPYALMLSGVVSSLPGILLCWIVMGIGMSGVGMVLMHDANHRTFSKSQQINRLLSKSLYLLGGFPPNWRQQHNILHHGFTNVDGQDEDINPAGVLRFSPHGPLFKIHRFQQWYAWFFYCLMTLSWATLKDFNQLSRYRKMEVKLNNGHKYNQLLIDLILTKTLYYLIFLIIPMIVLPISWYWTVTFFFAMHFVSGLILSAIFQTAHVMPTSAYPLPDKNGNLKNNWAIHQLMTTSNYAPKSKIFTWMIGGLNFQVEHHLFPNISHVHYKNISNLVKSATQKYELPYHVQRNFFMALYSHFKMLKVLGR